MHGSPAALTVPAPPTTDGPARVPRSRIAQAVREATGRSNTFVDALPAAPPPRTHADIFRISVKQGLRDQPDATAAAIKSELSQMLKLGVFTPVHVRDLSPSEIQQTIRSSMFIKHKISPQGEFLKCKARLVAGGDQQDKSLYESTSSPTASPMAILVEAGIAAAAGKCKASIDIGGAYLNADLAPTGVTVYMTIDPFLTSGLVALDPSFAKFVKPNGSVTVRLLKALYGTVEASRLWWKLAISILVAVDAVDFKPTSTTKTGSPTPAHSSPSATQARSTSHQSSKASSPSPAQKRNLWLCPT